MKIGGHFFGKGTEFDQVINRQLFLFELTDRNERPIHRNRTNHRVETRAISQTGVHIGVRFIDATAHSGNDFVDDPQEVLFVLKGDVGQLQFTCTFHENLFRTVHENIVHGVVFQKRLKRAKARHFVIQILAELKPLFTVQNQTFFFESFRGNRVDFLTQIALGRFFERREVQVVQQRLV